MTKKQSLLTNDNSFTLRKNDERMVQKIQTGMKHLKALHTEDLNIAQNDTWNWQKQMTDYYIHFITLDKRAYQINIFISPQKHLGTH